MIIRQLTKADINDVLLIENENYRDPWDYKIFVDEIVNSVNGEYYGIYKEKELIGYMGFWKLPDYIDVTNISVKPEYKRQGIASLLLIELEKKAVEYEMENIFLEVNVNNVEAINLYEKFGYKNLKTIKNYYTNLKEDAYLMQKEIANE